MLGFSHAASMDVRALAFTSAVPREKCRKLKDQRTAQGKEALEEHEEELRIQAEAHAKQMADAAT